MGEVGNALRRKREYDRYPGTFGRAGPRRSVKRPGAIANRLRRFGRGLVGGDMPVTRERIPAPRGKTSKAGAIIRGVANTLRAIETYRAAKMAEAAAIEEKNEEARKAAVEQVEAITPYIASVLEPFMGLPEGADIEPLLEIAKAGVTSRYDISSPAAQKALQPLIDGLNNADITQLMDIERGRTEHGLAQEVEQKGAIAGAEKGAEYDARIEQLSDPDYITGIGEEAKAKLPSLKRLEEAAAAEERGKRKEGGGGGSDTPSKIRGSLMIRAINGEDLSDMEWKAVEPEFTKGESSAATSATMLKVMDDYEFTHVGKKHALEHLRDKFHKSIEREYGKETLEDIKAKKKRNYKTPDDVKAAVKSGALSMAEGADILIKDFGFDK